MGPKVQEFRSMGALVTSSKKKTKGQALFSQNQDIKTWRPEGSLVAHLTEHQGAVNQMSLSPDHHFFATASDDGSVLLWDTQRLEKNVTNRSRLKITQQG